MINATDMALTDVDWPGYPPLFEVDGAQVMQVHFWSPAMHAWVKLVPVRDSTQEVVQDIIEVTPGDIRAIQQGEAQGLPKMEAIRRVLGVMPK